MRRSLRARWILPALAVAGGALALAACAGIEGPAATGASASAASGGPAGQTAPAAKPVRASAEDYRKLGADAASRGDYAKALTFYAEARYRAALSALADKLLEVGSYDLFVRCSQEAGRTPAFQDEFNDNAHGWNVRSDEYSQARILEGRLGVVRTTGDNSSFFWPSTGLDADRS